MKKKDLIDFGGNTWKDRKDSQEYGGREVRVLELAERVWKFVRFSIGRILNLGFPGRKLEWKFFWGRKTIKFLQQTSIKAR